MHYELKVNKNELQNIIHGLKNLHDVVVDKKASVKPNQPETDDMKKYYDNKRSEILTQIKSCESIL